MKNKPLVSIIIPCHNYGHLIAETLNCLLFQTYTNWEAIIIDDGSKDDTASKVASYSKADNRFRYFYQESKGVSFARNYGLSLVEGEYVQFLDADDLLTEEKIAIQVEYMENNEECALSYSFAKYFKTDKPNELYLNYNLKNEEWMPKASGNFNEILHIFIDTVMPINCPIIKSSFLKENSILFDTTYIMYEDWDFWLKCLYKGANFKFIDDPKCLTLIRVHNSSRTNSLLMGFFDMKLRKRMFSYINTYSGADKAEMIHENQRNFIFASRRLIRDSNGFNIHGLKMCYKELGIFFTFKMFFKELNSLRKGR